MHPLSPLGSYNSIKDGSHPKVPDIIYENIKRPTNTNQIAETEQIKRPQVAALLRKTDSCYSDSAKSQIPSESFEREDTSFQGA